MDICLYYANKLAKTSQKDNTVNVWEWPFPLISVL